jgi:cardiolipin synthase
VAAIVYDENKARQMRLLFEEDVKKSTKITRDSHKKRSLWFKIKERISRMLSPVL